MPIELINPATLPGVPIYHQVAVAGGSRTVYVAGQVAVDVDGNPVGADDLAAQVEQAYLNLHEALDAAGGTLADLVKVTVYLVDWQPEKMSAFVQGVGRAAATLGVDIPRPPLTGIGVVALAEPGLLVEVEGVAVLP